MNRIRILQKISAKPNPVYNLDLELLPLVFLTAESIQKGFIRNSKVYFDDEFPQKIYFKMKIGLDPKVGRIGQSMFEAFGTEDRKEIIRMIENEAEKIKFDSKKERIGKKNKFTAGALWLYICIGLAYLKITYPSIQFVKQVLKEEIDVGKFDFLEIFRALANGRHIVTVFHEKSDAVNQIIMAPLGSYIRFIAQEARFEPSNVASMILHGLGVEHGRVKLENSAQIRILF